MINLKRIYDNPEENDGYRILVDGLWPRGVSKDEANLDLWMKDIAPTDTLRKWFGHKEERWGAFKTRYKRQLNTDKRGKLVEKIKNFEKEKGTVTLLYSAKDEKRNNAVVLKEYLED